MKHGCNFNFSLVGISFLYINEILIFKKKYIFLYMLARRPVGHLLWERVSKMSLHLLHGVGQSNPHYVGKRGAGQLAFPPLPAPTCLLSASPYKKQMTNLPFSSSSPWSTHIPFLIRNNPTSNFHRRNSPFLMPSP